MRANRRRLAALAALALSAAVALGLRKAQRRYREQLAAPSPPPPPRPVARPAPVVLPVAPPTPPPRPTATVAPPRPWKRWRMAGLVAVALVVLGAGISASFAFRPGFGAQVAHSTLPTGPASIAQTRTRTTAPATTAPKTTAVTTGTTSVTRPAATPCAIPAAGWKEESVLRDKSTPPALVLTNFRFGNSLAEWGLLDPRLRWAHGDVMIAVADWTKVGSKGYLRSFLPGSLRVRPSDIARFGAFPDAIGHRLVRVGGRYLELWVEARPPTSAAFAAANNVLGRVHTLAACR